MWIQAAVQVIIHSHSEQSYTLIHVITEIYQWLSAIIPSMDYNSALEIRLEDTCLWFINGARFEQDRVAFFGCMGYVGSPAICGLSVS
jgi:hypothetical protein